MKRLQKGLTWLSVIIFFFGISIYSSDEVLAATRGAPDNPIVTNGRSIEKYFFDTYTDKSKIAAAYRQYQSYAKSNDDAPWYIRLGDTSKLSKDEIALSVADCDVTEDKKEDAALYVCWISYLKRANSSSVGSYAECANNSTGEAKSYNVGGGKATYYNTFGYGLKKTRTSYNVDKPGPLGENSKSYVWYDDINGDVAKHKRVTATKTDSGLINSFWMHTRGGEYGYVVYYVKYSELYRFIQSYNANSSSAEQYEPTQVEGQPYTQYDIYLNGSVAVHKGGNGWTDNSKSFETNRTYLNGTFGKEYVEKYADQNYNRHITLAVLKSVPIVVRAWDISTNKLVSEKTTTSTDYYLQAFDSDLSGVETDDGIYWDLSSKTHTTDIQQAMLKFLYVDTKDSDGNTGTRARVAYDIDRHNYESRDIGSYIRRRNLGLITEDDGYAVLYLPKRDGMTSLKGVETADAYAPIGFRMFAYDGAKRADLVAKDYAQLRTYDPNTGKAAVAGEFEYTKKTENYCYKVPEVSVGSTKRRVLEFDIRRDVKTSDGWIRHTTRMDWPKKDMEKYDSSKGGHDNESVVACKFFTKFGFTTRITKLKDQKLWRTTDGTRYVYSDWKKLCWTITLTLRKACGVMWPLKFNYAVNAFYGKTCYAGCRY